MQTLVRLGEFLPVAPDQAPGLLDWLEKWAATAWGGK